MIRLDAALVEMGLARSRTQAQALIKDGQVSVRVNSDFCCIRQPSYKVGPLLKADVRIADSDLNTYVSRGGIKMRGALAHLQLNPTGLHALDIGISTGGFSDFLLQSGVASITGVDVGHGQLHERLRSDPRVSLYEGVNARHLRLSALKEARQAFDLIVIDVSFISLTLILPSAVLALAPGGGILALVKPQFELGPDFLNKRGVVKQFSGQNERVREQAPADTIVREKIESCCKSLDLAVVDYFPCAIEGGDGNQEYFVYCQKR